MSFNNCRNLSLKLATIDCTTATKYYQLNQKITTEQKQKIKPYFKYYTKNDFYNLENVAGKTSGWMCRNEDVEIVEEILGIIQTREKQRKQLIETQNKITLKQEQKISNITELSFSI